MYNAITQNTEVEMFGRSQKNQTKKLHPQKCLKTPKMRFLKPAAGEFFLDFWGCLSVIPPLVRPDLRQGGGVLEWNCPDG